MVHYVFQVVTNLLTCCFIPPSDCQVQWKYWSYGSGIRDHNWTLGTLEVQRNLACLIFVHQRTGEICDLTSNRVPHVFLKGFFVGNSPKKIMAKKFKWWRFWSEKKTRTFFGLQKFHLGFWGRHPTLDQQGSTTGPSLWRKRLTPPGHFTANKKPQKNGTSPKGNESSSSFCIKEFRGYVKNFGGVSSPNEIPRVFHPVEGFSWSPWMILWGF